MSKFITRNTIRYYQNSPIKRFYSDDILSFSKKKQSKVSMKALLETGSGQLLHAFDNLVNTSQLADERKRVNIHVACFIHKELPIRLAHRIVELENSILYDKSSNVRLVVQSYTKSFEALKNISAPRDIDKENKFFSVVEEIYVRNSSTLIDMAKAANEIRSYYEKDMHAFASDVDIQKIFDDFYMSRIGLRMIVGQYLALREFDKSDNCIGLISPDCSPFKIAQDVIEDASYMCSRIHGDSPKVTIHGRTDLTFPYISSHISYILLELLKNSMRASIELHGIDDCPPIRIVIADGENNEDVTIKISDEGGGISRSNMHKIWSYLFTTADPEILRNMLEGNDDNDSPLAGLGFGLPLSRNYARYFGGELTIISMEGYGTDCFIHLPKLKSNNNTTRLKYLP